MEKINKMKIYKKDIDKISVDKFKSPVRFTDEDGKVRTYSGQTLKRKMGGFFQGGKTTTQIEKKLEEDFNIRDSQWEKRKNLMKIINPEKKQQPKRAVSRALMDLNRSAIAERANRMMDKIREGQKSAGAAGVSGGKVSAMEQNSSAVTGFAGNQNRPISPTAPIAPLNTGGGNRPFIPLSK